MNESRLRTALTVGPPILAALLMIGTFGLSGRIFPLDDTYIHLALARNLVQGHGLTLNAGEVSTGSSSPLWTILVASAFLVPGSPVPRVLVLSLLSYLAATILVTLITRRIARGIPGLPGLGAEAVAALAGIVFAVNGNVMWFAATGMESVFFIAAGLLAVLRYAHRGLSKGTAALAGLVATCRPEGIVLTGMILGWEFLVRRRSIRKGWPAALVAVAIASPYFLWSRFVTGHWLPTTYYGKAMTFVSSGNTFSLGELEGFWRSLWGYWRFNGASMPMETWLVVLAIAAAVFAVLHFAGRAEAMPDELRKSLVLGFLTVAWGFLHLVAYSIKFRTLYHQTRYLAPLYAVIPILAGGGAAALLAWRPLRAQPALQRAWVPLVMAIAVLPPIFSVAQVGQWRAVYHGNLNHIEHVHLAAAHWIRDNTPPDARIASFDVGVLRFESNRYTADLGGLTDPSIHPMLMEHRCGPYLLKKKVGWIVHLENPPSEWYTGINRDAGVILRQTFVKSFEVAPYPQPVLTHSTKMVIFRVEPLDEPPAAATSEEDFTPLDLRPVANSGVSGDPFKPGFEGGENLYPDLVPGRHEWGGVPFVILADDPSHGLASVLTTCYRAPVLASLPLQPVPSTRLCLAIDGGRTVQVLTPCTRLTVSYSDGTRTGMEVVPYSDVWDYWEQEEIPPGRILWKTPGTRQSLSSLVIPLDRSRLPTSLEVEREGNGDAGIVLFAVTQARLKDGRP